MNKYFEINERGSNIRCKVYCSDRSKVEKAVIYCTGFAGHKDNNAANRFAEKLLSKEKGVPSLRMILAKTFFISLSA